MSGFYDADKFFIYKRKGTGSDPFIPKEETHRITNNKVVLNEIPNEFNSVEVEGSFYETKGIVNNTSEYRVDYQTGYVYFHDSQEGVEVTFNYLGEGWISMPSSRVYVEEKNGSPTQTLKDVIDQGKLKWLQPVNTYADIANTYPAPEYWSIVQVLSDGKYYRFENGQWKWTQTVNNTQLDEINNKIGDNSLIDKPTIAESLKDKDDRLAANQNQLDVLSDDVGTNTNLPTWLQNSLYTVVKQHDDYLRSISVHVNQPPYNLKGDGTFEDMTKLQQAIDDAVIKGLGIQFKNGTHLINPIAFKHSTSNVPVRFIIGNDKSNTILKANATANTFIEWKNADRRHIRNIQFDANGKCQNTFDCSIELEAGSNIISMSSLIITGHINTGIIMHNFHDSHMTNVLIQGQDKVAIDANVTGGMFQVVDCALFGLIKIGAQYAAFINCVFNGIKAEYASFNEWTLINCYVYESPLTPATIYSDPSNPNITIGSVQLMGTDLELDTDGKHFIEGRFAYGVTMNGGTFLAQRLTTTTDFFGTITPSSSKVSMRFFQTGIKGGTATATPQFVNFNYNTNIMNLDLDQFRLGDGTRLTRFIGAKEHWGDTYFKDINGVGLARFVDGNFRLGEDSGGRWNTPHMRYGNYHLWVDDVGRLRYKGSAPTNNTDGTVCGSFVSSGIASTPSYIGQIAVVSGVGYMAVGTTSNADWKRITA